MSTRHEDLNQKNILETAKQAHAEQAEQIALLKAALPYLHKKESYEKAEKVIDFFREKVIAHFEWEERSVFPVALALGDLPFKRLIRQLQIEHISMIGTFDVIADIVIKHGFHFVDEAVRKQFEELSKGLIEALLKHAAKEDAELYPFLKQKGFALKGNTPGKWTV